MRIDPDNDNDGVRFAAPLEWLLYFILIAAVIAVPGGLAAAWYFENGSLAMISVVAIILFMAG